MLESSVIVNVTEAEVPVGGTFPVPVQPVQTYCVPAGPATGEVTDAVTLDPRKFVVYSDGWVWRIVSRRIVDCQLSVCAG